MKKQIYLVFQPSPILGRSPFAGGGFCASSVTPEAFINALNTEIAAQSLNWSVMLDNTESDSKLLASKGADALICTPGLRFMFIRNGYDKHKIVYLDALTYADLDVSKTVELLKQIPDL